MEGIGSRSVQIMTDPDPGGPKNIRILQILIRIHNIGYSTKQFRPNRTEVLLLPLMRNFTVNCFKLSTVVFQKNHCIPETFLEIGNTDLGLYKMHF
jgi:hypothetical protein